MGLSPVLVVKVLQPNLNTGQTHLQTATYLKFKTPLPARLQIPRERFSPWGMNGPSEGIIEGLLLGLSDKAALKF